MHDTRKGSNKKIPFSCNILFLPMSFTKQNQTTGMRTDFLLPLAACLVLTAGTALAQDKNQDKKGDKKLRLHYERQAGDRKSVIDRTFADQAQLDTFLDSLNAHNSGGGRTRIIIGDSDDAMRFKNINPDMKVERDVRVMKKRRNDDGPFAREDWGRFEKDMERLGQNMERWGQDFGQKFNRDFGQNFNRNFRFDFPEEGKGNVAPRVWGWDGGSNSSTVRGLNVYPNRPFNQTLNLRFTAPAKGDVTILVTDVKGHEVAKETVKDFEGDYVGQITLSKKAEKGTYFVTVTQGEDGTVRRVAVE